MQSAASATAAVEKTSNFKAYVNILDKTSSIDSAATATSSTNGDLGVAVEKENTASNKKYSISGQANNAIVKQILGKLLTPFVANKLASDSEIEVRIKLKIIGKTLIIFFS